MNFGNFITSYTGLIHFIASMLALFLGTLVLILPKGTLKHKNIGRLYSLAMIVVLITAFMTYRLFGTWGIFHWTAVISSLTLACGLIPILTRRPTNNYRSLHYSFMYWSVMGVYGAFVSETFVRMPKLAVESGIPNNVFYSMPGIGTALVMGLGVYFFIKNKPKWDKQFGGKNQTGTNE
jgi:predicted membrane channel-forming protein YqfA (hemolysin III family)